MSEQSNKPGFIAWLDQTSGVAEKTREFYEKVVGWKSSPVSMGDYNDYCMIPPGGENPVAGICHKSGPNSDLPSGWIAYIIVDDLESSIQACRRNGGKVISEPRNAGDKAKYCIIEDPAGAISALFCNK